jgi:hypothetical protein
MEQINQIITWFLVIIPLGGTARILYCLAAISTDMDARDVYQKRIKHVLMFVAISECVSGLLKIVAGYYGG